MDATLKEMEDFVYMCTSQRITFSCDLKKELLNCPSKWTRATLEHPLLATREFLASLRRALDGRGIDPLFATRDFPSLEEEEKKKTTTAAEIWRFHSSELKQKTLAQVKSNLKTEIELQKALVKQQVFSSDENKSRVFGVSIFSLTTRPLLLPSSRTDVEACVQLVREWLVDEFVFSFVARVYHDCVRSWDQDELDLKGLELWRKYSSCTSVKSVGEMVEIEREYHSYCEPVASWVGCPLYTIHAKFWKLCRILVQQLDLLQLLCVSLEEPSSAPLELEDSASSKFVLKYFSKLSSPLLRWFVDDPDVRAVFTSSSPSSSALSRACMILFIEACGSYVSDVLDEL